MFTTSQLSDVNITSYLFESVIVEGIKVSFCDL